MRHWNDPSRPTPNPMTPDEEAEYRDKVPFEYIKASELHGPSDPEQHPDPRFRPSTRRNLNLLFEAYKAGGRRGLEEMHMKLFKK